jgi:hypothetical protein
MADTSGLPVCLFAAGTRLLAAYGYVLIVCGLFNDAVNVSLSDFGE